MITLCWYCTCSTGKPIKNDTKADPISKVQSVSNDAYGVPTDLMNVQENVAYSSMQSHSQPPTTSSHVYDVVVNTGARETVEDHSRTTNEHKNQYEYIEVL